VTIGWLRHQPAGDVLRAAWGQLLWDRFEGALRVHAAPSMAQFARAAAAVHTSAAALVATLGLGPPERVSAAVQEPATTSTGRRPSSTRAGRRACAPISWSIRAR
jgi:hypothetical protein